jgi:Domain of Unknown Function (DUF1206)
LALTTVLGQPFGRTLLLVVVVGLLDYAAWRILQGLFDPERLGNNWHGLAIRASLLARGALHAVLGWQAFRLYRGLSAGSGTTEREVATEAFRWPLGDWLVVLAGLGLIGFAVQQVYAAITCRLERNLDVEEMRRETGEWAVGLSRFGVAARAVVFALLGWALVVAGWFRDPSEVGTTLRTLECPHDCPCGPPKPRLQSQCQPRRLIGEVTGSEGFAKNLEVGREADFRLANRPGQAAFCTNHVRKSSLTPSHIFTFPCRFPPSPVFLLVQTRRPPHQIHTRSRRYVWTSSRRRCLFDAIYACAPNPCVRV